MLASDRVSFSIRKGELVAFIGPNGAGKSTTLKILSGILHPDAGRAQVLERVPWLERSRLGFEIGTVFGQRSQLWYHLPARDTFALLARVYEVEPTEHRRRLSLLVEAFELGPQTHMNIQEDVRRGDIAYHLPRPVSYPNALRRSCSSFSGA